MGGKTTKFIRDLLIDLIIIALLVLGIRSFIVSPFQVHGSSMCPTFNQNNGVCENDFGEYLLVSKFSYLLGQPQRGDVIVLRPPNLPKDSNEEFFIKRIIGLPGETININNGEVYINGKKIEERYIGGAKTYISNSPEKKFEIPAGKYFVMGDNREHSTDSRYCFRDAPIGCKGGKTPYITKDMMEGKAWIILFPFKEIGLVPDARFDIR